jgi:hypothetical protein
MVDTSGAAPEEPEDTRDTEDPPLEQAASVTRDMAPIRQYLSLLMCRMVSPLITVNESNEAACRNVGCLRRIAQILTLISTNVDYLYRP